MNAPPARACFVHFASYEVDPQVQRPFRALTESGADVHVVGLGGPGSWAQGRGTVTLHPVTASKSRSSLARYAGEYAGFLWRALRIVAALDRSHRFQLVQVHNMPDALVLAGLVPRLRGSALVLQLDDTFPELLETLAPRPAARLFGTLARWEERASVAFAHHVIAVTPEVAALLERRGVGVGRTTAVLNTPDPGVFGPPRTRCRWPPAGRMRVVYHGGLASRYGVETLIDAFGVLERRGVEASLDIYGLFDDSRRLRARARQAAPRSVTLASRPVAHVDIPRLLAEADAAVVPTRLDPFTRHLLPVKLLEYVHMGLPVVASRLPLVERHFGHDALRLVEPGSPEALAGALTGLIESPDDEVRTMTRIAADRLTALGPGHQRRRYQDLVARVCAGRRRHVNR